MTDDIEALEIYLEISECGELLQRYGVTPTPELVAALWDWMEEKRNGGGDE